jgi:hypothetical protein
MIILVIPTEHIRFHAYNALAGGAFSKNFAGSAAVAAGSRFDCSTAQAKLYRDRPGRAAACRVPSLLGRGRPAQSASP